ncbi:hypothetical protein Tco_0357117 [Tanacetum coccineum]
MTIHASIIESSLEIVNMLRRYEFEASTSLTIAATSPQDEDRMWSSLRKVNTLKRGEFFSRMEDFTSTMPLTIAPDVSLLFTLSSPFFRANGVIM